MTHSVKIEPVSRGKAKAVGKVLRRFLGPASMPRVRALMRSGGTVLSDLNASAAARIAAMLTEAGAKATVVKAPQPRGRERQPSPVLRVRAFQAEPATEISLHVGSVGGGTIASAKTNDAGIAAFQGLADTLKSADLTDDNILVFSARFGGETLSVRHKTFAWQSFLEAEKDSTFRVDIDTAAESPDTAPAAIAIRLVDADDTPLAGVLVTILQANLERDQPLGTAETDGAGQLSLGLPQITQQSTNPALTFRLGGDLPSPDIEAPVGEIVTLGEHRLLVGAPLVGREPLFVKLIVPAGSKPKATSLSAQFVDVTQQAVVDGLFTDPGALSRMDAETTSAFATIMGLPENEVARATDEARLSLSAGLPAGAVEALEGLKLGLARAGDGARTQIDAAALVTVDEDTLSDALLATGAAHDDEAATQLAQSLKHRSRGFIGAETVAARSKRLSRRVSQVGLADALGTRLAVGAPLTTDILDQLVEEEGAARQNVSMLAERLRLDALVKHDSDVITAVETGALGAFRSFDDVLALDTQAWAKGLAASGQPAEKIEKKAQDLTDRVGAVAPALALTLRASAKLEQGLETALEAAEASGTVPAQIKRFSAMGAEDIALDTSLSVPERAAQIKGLVNAARAFFKDNQDLDIATVNLSADAPSVKFGAVEPALHEPVLAQTKAMQTILSIGATTTEAEALMGAGLLKPSAIARLGAGWLVRDLGLAKDRAETMVANANNRFADALAAYYGSQPEQTVPRPQGSTVPRPQGSTVPADCDCEDCASLLGPVAYFVDLMRFVDAHILDQVPQGDDAALIKRRPDFWTLPLTCQAATEEVSQLSLVVDMLRSGLGEAEVSAATAARGAVHLPYDGGFHAAHQMMDAAGFSLSDVADAVFGPSRQSSRFDLGLSTPAWEALTGSAAPHPLAEAFGGEATLPVPTLLVGLGIDIDALTAALTLDEALGHDPVHLQPGIGEEPARALQVTEAWIDRFDRAARFARATGWRLAEALVVLHSQTVEQATALAVLAQSAALSPEEALATVEGPSSIVVAEKTPALRDRLAGDPSASIEASAQAVAALVAQALSMPAAGLELLAQALEEAGAGLSASDPALIRYALLSRDGAASPVQLWELHRALGSDNTAPSLLELRRAAKLLEALPGGLAAFLSTSRPIDISPADDLLAAARRAAQGTPVPVSRLAGIPGLTSSALVTAIADLQSTDKIALVQTPEGGPAAQTLTLLTLDDIKPGDPGSGDDIAEPARAELLSALLEGSVRPDRGKQVLTEGLNIEPARFDAIIRMLDPGDSLTTALTAADQGADLQAASAILASARALTLFLDGTALPAAVVDLVLAAPDLVGFVNGEITLAAAKRVAALIQVSALSAGAADAGEALVLALTATSAAEQADSLAALAGVSLSAAQAAVAAIAAAPDPIAALLQRTRLAQLAERISVSVEDLLTLASARGPLPADVGARLSLGAAQSAGEQPRESARSALLAAERDAWVEAMIIRRGIARTSVEDLFHSLLVDTEIQPCARTTRLLFATQALQLYVERCLAGLERADDGSWAVIPTEAMRSEWVWRKNFRTWAANRTIFLHPENYLEPNLRREKSSLFEEMEKVLTQGALDRDTVEAAFRRYIEGYSGLADIAVVGACQDWASNDLHMIGRVSDTGTLWHRIRRHGANWSAWQKIDAQVAADRVSPVVFQGRLYLFWLDIRTTVENEFANGSATLNAYIHRVGLSYIVKGTDGAWSAPHAIALSEREGDEAIVEDRVHTYRGRRGGNQAGAPQRYAVHDAHYLDHTRPLAHYTLSVPGMSVIHLRPVQVAGRDTELRLFLTVPGLDQLNGLAIDFYHGRLRSGRAPDPEWVQAFNRVLVCDGDTRPQERTLYSVITNEAYQDESFLRHMFLNSRPRLSAAEILEQGGRPFLDLGAGDIITALPGPGGIYLLELADGSSFLIEEGPQSADPLDIPIFNWTRIGGVQTGPMLEALSATGIVGLMAPATQEEVARVGPAPDWHARIMKPKSPQLNPSNFGGSEALYLREIFFHAPALASRALMAQGDFDGALDWLSLIYDPTVASGEPEWRNLELAISPAAALAEDLGDPAAIAAYRADPFNAHAIARVRRSAYRQWTRMAYAETLLDWGDSLFSLASREALNEATLLYIRAHQVLGSKRLPVPQTSSRGTAPTVANLDLEDPFAPEVEAASGPAGGSAGGSAVGGVITTTAVPATSLPAPVALPSGEVLFTIPRNPKPDMLRDRLADRLFKLRNCRGLDGSSLALPLYAPPIDPGLLAQARAAGLSPSQAIAITQSGAPRFRFSYLLSKAREEVGRLAAFGNALLQALEKADAAELAALRARYRSNLESFSTAPREIEVAQAKAYFDIAKEQERDAQAEVDYYQGLLDQGLSGSERAEEALRGAAHVSRMLASVFFGTSSIARLLPQLGSPFAMVYGGEEAGESASKWAEFLRTSASIAESDASRIATASNYKRREESWTHSLERSQSQLRTAQQRRVAAEMGVDLLQREHTLKQIAADYAESEFETLTEQFSAASLYLWHARELRVLLNKCRERAERLAAMTEAAFRFERDEHTVFARGNPGGSPRQDLMAADHINDRLSAMEQAWIAAPPDRQFLSQTFSLAEIGPNALLELRRSGSCQFDLVEAGFDIVYPGHVNRRLVAVRLTLPTVTGPFTNVNARLELTSSRVRRHPEGDLIEEPTGRYDAVAMSSGENDDGGVSLAFGPERIAKFEGAGAVSSWRLDLPSRFRSFDYDSIADVLIHLDYTARDAGQAYRTQVEEALGQTLSAVASQVGLHRAISMAERHPLEMRGFAFPDEDGEHTLSVALSSLHFPFALGAAGLVLGRKVRVILDGAQDQGTPAGSLRLEVGPKTSAVWSGEATVTSSGAGSAPEAIFSADGPSTELGDGLPLRLSMPQAEAARLFPGGPGEPMAKAIRDIIVIVEASVP